MHRSAWSVLVILAFTAPVASAGWGAKGGAEPDTPQDLDGAMITQAPTDPNTLHRPVYFQGFLAAAPGLVTSVNPNVATAQTGVLVGASVPVALLGIWRDCNLDGYIGLGDQGLLVYRSELLLDATHCAPRAPVGDLPWHNDGTWVVELIPIGYDDVRTSMDENPLNVNDTSARVWADWGLPGASTSGTCEILPLAAGAMRSTGGMVRWADCMAGGRGMATIESAAATAGRPDVPPMLDQPNPWGDEDDGSAARVFDCGVEEEYTLRDPTAPPGHDGLLRRVQLDEDTSIEITDDEGRIASRTVYAPSPALHEGGTPAGTVNETEAELTDCRRGGGQGELADVDGDRRGSDAEAIYAPEGDRRAMPAGSLRRGTDHVFTYEEGRRGDPFLGDRTPSDLGVGAPGLGGMWAAEPLRAGHYDPAVDRESLGPRGVSRITFYATLSPILAASLGLTLPPVSGTYGAEGCGAGTFDCDPARWWRDEADRDVVPRDARLGSVPGSLATPKPGPETEIGVRIGASYFLRDVDCFDASALALRDAGAHAGALTGDACARPA